ncbi:MAG: polyphosphate--glucose phosphotransferase [Ilumatobacteraceae bacterium]
MTAAVGFGIDIGGTGMKAAPVDLTGSGQLLADRYRISTPSPATPDAVAEVVVELVRHFEWEGPVGIALPSVVRNGVVHSAANIDDSWIDVDAQGLFASLLGCDVVVMNDADAAGVAEMSFGAGVGRNGVVMALTFGTGIGSALFVDGHLVPNTELGHLEFRGDSIEKWAAASARKRDDLSWRKWAARVSTFLQTIDALFSPDLLILGGGASKSADKWVPLLEARPEIVVADFANSAGIVGAAMESSKL